MTNKYKISLITIVLAVVLVLLSAIPTLAVSWNNPPDSPPPADCPSSNPGCNPPVNVSGSIQTKTGLLYLPFITPIKDYMKDTFGFSPSQIKTFSTQFNNIISSESGYLNLFGYWDNNAKRNVKVYDNLDVVGTTSSQFYQICNAAGACSPLTVGSLPAGTASGQTLRYDSTGTWRVSNFLRNIGEDRVIIGPNLTGGNESTDKNFVINSINGVVRLTGPYMDLLGGKIGGVFFGGPSKANAINTIQDDYATGELTIFGNSTRGGNGVIGDRKVKIYDNLDVVGNINICNAAGACSPVTTGGGSSQWTDTSAKDGIYYLNKVGIGTNKPNVRLSLGNSVDQKKLAIYENSDGSGFYGFGLRSGFLDFWAGNTNRMTIAGGTGNVGIGNTSPTTPLDVGSNTYAGPAYVNVNSASDRVAGFRWSDAGATLWNLYKPNDGTKDLRLQNGTTDYLVVKRDTGNLGVGEISPAAKLDVAGTIFGKGLGVVGSGIISDYLVTGDSSKITNNSSVKLDVNGFSLIRGNGARFILGDSSGLDPDASPVWSIDNYKNENNSLRFYYSPNLGTAGVSKMTLSKEGRLSAFEVLATEGLYARGFSVYDGVLQIVPVARRSYTTCSNNERGKMMVVSGEDNYGNFISSDELKVCVQTGPNTFLWKKVNLQ